MIDAIAKLLKALHSDANPGQIALAFVFGLFMGLTPLWSAHNLVVLLLAMIVRVNFGGFLLAWTLFSALAYLMDPTMIALGEAVLAMPQLQSLWTSMYASDFWRLMHFNHTLTMGSLVLSLILALPLFFSLRVLIVKYRSSFKAFVEKSKIMKLFKASPLYKAYAALSDRGII